MKKTIKGNEEDGNFTMTLKLNRDIDNYLIILLNKKNNAVEYHVSKNGTVNLILTLYNRIKFFRQIISYVVSTVLTDMLKIHSEIGVESFRRTIVLREIDKEKKKKRRTPKDASK